MTNMSSLTSASQVYGVADGESKRYDIFETRDSVKRNTDLPDVYPIYPDIGADEKKRATQVYGVADGESKRYDIFETKDSVKRASQVYGVADGESKRYDIFETKDVEK
jgi:hypothetical protein